MSNTLHGPTTWRPDAKRYIQDFGVSLTLGPLVGEEGGVRDGRRLLQRLTGAAPTF